MFSLSDLKNILDKNELRGQIKEEIYSDISIQLEALLDKQILSTDMRAFVRSTWYNLAIAICARETCMKQSTDKRWTGAVQLVIGNFINEMEKTFRNAGWDEMVDLAHETTKRTFQLHDRMQAEKIIEETRNK